MEILYIGLIIFLVYALWLVTRGAIYLPSFTPAIKEIISAPEIKKGMKVVDLGSGDGRLLIALARLGIEAHGYEINPILVIWSRIKIRQAGFSSIAKVHLSDFWHKDLSSYDVVIIFGLESIMSRLENKLVKELRPGAYIFSNIYQLPTWPEVRHGNSVYLYKKS